VAVDVEGKRQNASWMPFIVIVLAQIQLAINVSALPVSIGPLVADLNTSAMSVGSALVIYSLFVAAFVILGAKIGKIIGTRLVFQISVLAHGLAMGLMALSSNTTTMNGAQALAGFAAAALVPTLVVLIAANYFGRQQAQALGILAGTPAMAGAAAFFIAGFLATALSWRFTFGILTVLSVIVFWLSFRLKPIPRRTEVRVDLAGAVLVAMAVGLISFGFNNLIDWGIVLARANAPFSLLGLSPAPFMVVLGIVFGQAFFAWSHRCRGNQKTPLLALEVLDSPQERAATYSLLIISALGPAVNFLIPLYLQIIRGQSSLQTALNVIPYTLAIFIAAVLVVRLYARLSTRQIGSFAFGVVAAGLALLAFVIQNDWGAPAMIFSLIILGLGEGALVTLVFNVLVSESPPELAGDVGALRGTANNLSTALGTATASILVVTLLTLYVTNSLVEHPTLPVDLQAQVNLDNIRFVSNDELKDVLSSTTATPEQVNEAVRLNEAARLRALQDAFLILAAVALLAIVPARWLPKYNPRVVEGTSRPG